MGLRGQDDSKIHRQRRRSGALACADVQGRAEGEAVGSEEVHNVLHRGRFTTTKNGGFFVPHKKLRI